MGVGGSGVAREEPSNENFTSCLILIFRVEGQVHLSDENVFMVWVDASVSKQSPDPRVDISYRFASCCYDAVPPTPTSLGEHRLTVLLFNHKL